MKHTTFSLAKLCIAMIVAGLLLVGAPASAQISTSTSTSNTFQGDISVRPGHKGNDVCVLQRLLNDRGFDVGTVDCSFGPKTGQALRNFQRANNLTDDGIAGRLTKARLLGSSTTTQTQATTQARVSFNAPSQSVRRGARGTHVRQVQQALADAGFDVGTIDGVAGARTHQAIEQFQRARGLKADGVAGKNTYVHLFVSTTSPRILPIPDEKGESTLVFKPATITQAFLRDLVFTEPEMKKFGKVSEMVEFLEQTGNNYGYIGFADSGSVAIRSEALTSFNSGAPSISSDSARLSAPVAKNREFSNTNVQEFGVDEADITKTDGTYIYTLSGNDVHILSAYPPERMQSQSVIAFRTRPQGLYLDGDTLIVYGSNASDHFYRIMPEFGSRTQSTFVKIFDVSNRKNPVEIGDYDIEGSYVDSRKVDDDVYVITQTWQTRNRPEPLPVISQDGKALYTSSEDSDTCVGCPDVWYVDSSDSSQFVVVAHLESDVPRKKMNAEVFLVPRTEDIYASAENLYLTHTSSPRTYIANQHIFIDLVKPLLSDTKQKQLDEIDATSSRVLSDQEKLSKKYRIATEYVQNLPRVDSSAVYAESRARSERLLDFKEQESAFIHKIGLGGTPRYLTSGSVPGTIHNRFSMSEHDGHLRVATTKQAQWLGGRERRESSNNMYVLDRGLRQIGALEGLAPGERIFSARFMGNRAYMVTFRQVDPLFVIDLSNPRSPKELGQLKIPGVSDYLHPYDENTLIGFGRDGNDERLTGKLKLSLFDVRNVRSPQEVDTFVWDGDRSYSIALNEPKAFLFDKSKNLLVVPASVTHYTTGLEATSIARSARYFQGAYVFSITNRSIDLDGTIAHSRDEEDTSNYYRDRSTQVVRSLFIEDSLYTLSQRYVQAHELGDLDHQGTLDLVSEKSDYEILR